MYLRHFGLREFPFSITPDTSFFFGSGASQEALNTLVVAIRMGEGFIKITGEVGTGKTLLCRKLMASLEGDEYTVAYIPNPYLDPVALFIELSAELGIAQAEGAPNQHQLLRGLNERLLALTREGRKVVICLDEVQAMPIETLEALRLLTNLETEKRKLIQVVIFGQPELEAKLNHSAIRQLKQRITFHYHLQPLSGPELSYYLHHRLVVAGYQGGPVFTTAATWLLERKTRRVPRLVNIVAHKSLLSAFGKGARRVTVFDVLAASNDTDSTRTAPSWRLRGLFFLVLAGCAASLAWIHFQ
ncbi:MULTISPECIES: AAA family ATPase [Ramlibacter]|uniref:AAA family ATPase n=1 Tax=Ramlibacter aquaticus TaxID=2780094 RepID=A0ABR9SLI6_9BURK|nr:MULTISPECIES: AAA family ATPase [Ramlibacter]MBE7942724.1 AAA family ATPase [Ramlibacter aquaticus]